MLFSEKAAVRCEIHIEQTNKLCGREGELLKFKTSGT